ncbi:MAG TPA: DUF1592 domain-containing protein [Polyangiaceae bacterium]|nr:DUF1592 domain-containing protein [Polyangiaceae bacterium]
MAAIGSASLGALGGCTAAQEPSLDLGGSGAPALPSGGNSSLPGAGGPGQGGAGVGVPGGAGGTSPGAGGAAGAPISGAGMNGTGTGGADTACFGTGLTASKRIVRLSLNQIVNSLGTLIDPALRTSLAAEHQVVDAQHRAFPPLQDPREGNSIIDATWKTIDGMAQTASEYVRDNFAAVTGCGATPTDECAREYLFGFARKAYRRPLTEAEEARLETLYTTGLKGAGATTEEAVEHGVYAILQAPQFVYRTELGPDWTVDGPLTQWELASALSYFLTDDMPDAELLDAAAQNRLTTADEIGAQVDRILQTPEARRNLHGAMMSYFAYQDLEPLVIDDAAFTDGVRNSMYHEGELFLDKVLWSGTLSDLLLSRQTFVNASLASIYGVPSFPAPGTQLDADGFGLVELPPNRTGLLTQAGFLTTRSRPDGTSVVGRGLLVKKVFLCTETPQPPDALGEIIEEAEKLLGDATEREKAEYRTTTAPCLACHMGFDAYGLALDTYDIIGRYRTTDAKGRPIDPSVTLPTEVGGAMAKDAIEMAQKLVESGAFSKCMGMNLANYALADVSAGAVTIESCAASQIAEAFATTDQTFSSLVRAVATSAPFINRSKGAAQ